jgi:hypothetical protein
MTLAAITATSTAAKKRAKKAREAKAAAEIESVGMDLKLWNIACVKLTLRENGELMRALVRAQRAKRPNRDQRLLLAVFTRESAGGKPCKA